MYGHLPTKAELERWSEAVMRHSAVPVTVEKVLVRFSTNPLTASQQMAYVSLAAIISVSSSCSITFRCFASRRVCNQPVEGLRHKMSGRARLTCDFEALSGIKCWL